MTHHYKSDSFSILVHANAVRCLERTCTIFLLMFQPEGKAGLLLKGSTQSNFILFPSTEDIRYLSTPIKDLPLDIS